MKIILSESQIHKLREDNSDFIIAPYPTPEEYWLKNPEGYKRSKELGTLDLFYPNSTFQPKRGRPIHSKPDVVEPTEPKRGRGRPRLLKPDVVEPTEPKRGRGRPRLSMTNIVDPPKNKMGRKKNPINVGMWVSTHTEDFKVISVKDEKIIGKSFCDPNKKVQIDRDDIINIQGIGREKVNDLKMDFSKYYKEAGLDESKMVKGREIYRGGSNIVLFLDDSRNPFTSAQDWIQKHSQIGTEDIHVIHVKTYQEFVNHIENYGLPKQIIFDHDLRKTDKEGGDGCLAAAWIVKFCVTNKRRLPKWSISSANKYGRCCIGNILRKFEDLTDSKSEV